LLIKLFYLMQAGFESRFTESDIAKMNSIEILLHVFDEAFDHRSWHGTNLHGSIRGMSAAEACWRAKKERKNINEHVLHCAYWKYTVRRRMLGEKRGSFPLAGSNWFARPRDGKIDEVQWKSDVQLLVDTHRSLRQAIAALEPARLEDQAAGGVTTILQLISGITAHDLYHAGQIQLIKRLYTNPRSGK
jgi:uncharacterized damage-inducible protein DinB